MAVMLIFSLHASNLRAADDGMGWYDPKISGKTKTVLSYGIRMLKSPNKPDKTGLKILRFVMNLQNLKCCKEIWMSRVKLPS